MARTVPDPRENRTAASGAVSDVSQAAGRAHHGATDYASERPRSRVFSMALVLAGLAVLLLVIGATFFADPAGSAQYWLAQG